MYTDNCYEEIVRINRQIQSLQLHKWKWLRQVPQDSDVFDVQLLQDNAGNEIAWVTNWNWLEPTSGNVQLPGGAAISVALPPGGSLLYSIE